ncbi:MAG: metal-dependent hydrolase [Candidatus Saccharibacteria bacterium]|nr:metal-dependent hydrolase [Candidatus Saccharibacteria bacterium]
MANFKGHIVGGVLVNTGLLAVAKFLPGDILRKTNGILSNWQFIVALYVIAVLFALWPDVDTNSKGQDIFYGIGFVTDIALVLTGRFEAAAYLGLLGMTPIVGHHRGWTHSKIAMLLVPLPIVLVPYLHDATILPTALLVYAASVGGYFSHLLLDGLIFKHFRIKGNRYD